MANKIEVEFSAKDKLSGELKSLESGVIRFVGAVSSALTALTLVSFPIREAAQFQKGLLDAARTTGYTRSQVNLLRDDLIGLSKQIGVSATELARIATLGGQAGIGANGNVKALTSFTQQISTASLALGVSVDEAAESFGKLITIFDISPDKFSGAISALVEVGNASNATSTELFDVSRRIGNLGGSIDFSQAVALSGALIDLGQTAETAGTTLTKIFSDMKAKAADFANFISSDKGSVSPDEFASLVATNGIKALNLYLNRLNEVSATEAAVQKVQLTGGGRIFEAVTKLQLQLKKSNDLREDAARLEEELNKKTKEGGFANENEAAQIRTRVEELRNAAEQANIVDRLTVKARNGFNSATAAQDAQALALSGLTAQYSRFLRNVEAVGIATGNSGIPGLTRLFRSLSEAIGNPETIKDASDAVADIVQAAEDLSSVIGKLLSFFSGGKSLDIGNLIKLTALATTVVGIRLLTSLLNAAGRSIASTISPLGTLGKLFGLNAQALDKTATSSNAASAGMSAFSKNLTGLAGAVANYSRGQRTLQQLAAKEPTLAKAAVNGVFSLQAARDSLARTNDKLAAAEEKLANAVGARQLAGARRSVAYYKADSDLKTQAVADLENATNPIVESYMNAVDKIKTGISGIKSAYAAVRNITWASIIPAAAINNTSVSLKGLALSLGDVGLKIIGIRTEWAITQGVMARGGLILAGIMGRLAQAVGLVFSAITKIGTVLIFAAIAKEILDLLGLLDPLLKGVEKLFSFFGKEPPSYLRSRDTNNKNAEVEAQALRNQNSFIERRNTLASTYNGLTAANIELLSNQARLTKELTYDLSNPVAAQNTFNQAIKDASAAIAFNIGQTEVLTQKREELENVNRQLLTEDNRDRFRQLESRKDTLLREVVDLDRSIKTAQKGANVLQEVLKAYLSPEQFKNLFGTLDKDGSGLVTKLTDLNEKVRVLTLQKEALTEAQRNLSGADIIAESSDKSFKKAFDSVAALNSEAQNVNTQLEQTGRKIEEVTKEIDSSVGKTAGDALKTLAKEAPEDLDKVIQPLRDLAKTAYNFQGLGRPVFSEQDLASTAAQLAANRELVAIYKNQKEAAEAGAIAAETAVKQTVIDIKKLATATSTSLDEIRKARKLALEEGKREVATRLDEPELRKATLRIEQRAQDKELQIREQYRLKIEAFGVAEGVSEKLRIQSLEQDRDREIANLRLATDAKIKERERFVQAGALQRVVRDTQANVDLEVENVRKYGLELSNLRKVLDNPEEDLAKRSRAMEEQATILDKLKTSYGNIEGAIRNVSTLRVEDRLLLSEEQVTNFNNQLTTASGTLQVALDNSTKGLASLYREQASNFAGALAGVKSVAESNAIALSDGIKKNFTSFADGYKQIAAQLVSNGQFQAINNELAQLKSSATLDPASILKFGQVQERVLKTIQDSATAAEEAKTDYASLTDAQKAQADELAKTIARLAKDPLNGESVEIPADVTAALSPATLEELTKSATGALSNLTATVGKVNMPTSLSTGSGSTGSTLLLAKGGLVNVPGYASGGSIGGGKVVGRGTGTSDSILARLSNGEFVMDALTTSKFGSGFFSFLQRLARGGNVGGLMQNLAQGLSVPSFAAGGAIGLPNFESDFKMGSVTYLDISYNNRKVGKVAGDKGTIGSLVKVLQDIERSST